MLRLIEVASQSETFSKRVLENHELKIFAGMAQPGHYRGVFSIDRPPLLAVRRPWETTPAQFHRGDHDTDTLSTTSYK